MRILLISLLIISSTALASVPNLEQKLGGRPFALKINGHRGRVTVLASSDGQVRIRNEKRNKKTSSLNVRIDPPNLPGVAAVLSINYAELKSLTVEVPSDRVGDISVSSGRGMIQISGFENKTPEFRPRSVSARNKDGGISLKRIYATNGFQVHSVNGSVAVEDIVGDVRVATRTGRIRLTEIANGRVEAKTVLGRIEAEHIDGSVSLATASGTIDASAIEGHAMAKSISGKIRLAGIAGNAWAQSKSGALDVTANGFIAAMSETANVDLHNSGTTTFASTRAKVLNQINATDKPASIDNFTIQPPIRGSALDSTVLQTRP